MKSITSFVKYNLIPAAFHNIPRLLPEFGFVLRGANWVSTTNLKITGETGKSVGKVCVWQEAPWCIKDYTRGSVPLINYIMERDRISFIEAVKKIALDVGTTLPEDPDFNEEKYRSYQSRISMLECAADYMRHLLRESDDPEVVAVRNYLENSRGYSREVWVAMGLGFMPAQESLFKYLEDKGYDFQMARDTLRLPAGAGDTHNLAIPYRSAGHILGFKFRTIENHEPKYLNNSGMEKNSGLFNLTGVTGDKDVVVVEGEFDALHATVKGIKNVVATGGSSLSREQVESAIRLGAKSFTICFDNNGEEKKEKTVKFVFAAIKNTNSVNPSIKIYVVSLPSSDGKKVDPDSYIREHGPAAFQKLIDTAPRDWQYQLQNILRNDGNPVATPREIDNVLEKVLELSSQILDPLDKDRFNTQFAAFSQASNLGITQESLALAEERITEAQDQEQQKKELKALLSEASALQEKGDTAQALDLMKSRMQDILLIDKNSDFKNLLIPSSEDELRKKLANKPQSILSGYFIEGEPLLLPAAALSFIVAATSHGKTTMLLNMLLRTAIKYPNSKFYFFTLEEDESAMILKLLNIYVGEELAKNNRRSINTYYAEGKDTYIKTDKLKIFNLKKDKFFKELIDSGRINVHYVSEPVETLAEMVTFLKKHSNIGGIFIDYMQLLHLAQDKNRSNSRQEELKKICLLLKDLAVDTGIPIILGCQFNREVTNLLKMHPTRISEAGDIERVANLAIGLWNHNFPGIFSTEAERKEFSSRKMGPGGLKDKLHICIMKNRDGRIGLEEDLHFFGNTGHICNIDPDNGPIMGL
ncbi:MAG TPA: DnaB-like helicase C-terminal domain-containing protein [bacterium]|nr:DnaB-like helicase C-terminal domain-containing protein [bacterium]